MRARVLVWFVICLMAAGIMARGQETISQFAKRTMGLDLAAVPFGVEASERPEFTKRESQFSTSGTVTNIVWYGGPGAGMYATNFAGRSVSYGFVDGQLACIRLNLSAIELTTDAKAGDAEKEGVRGEVAAKARPKQEALNRLREEIRSIAKEHGAKHPSGECLEFEDSPFGPFKLQYCSFCNPEENLFCNITITKEP